MWISFHVIFEILLVFILFKFKKSPQHLRNSSRTLQFFFIEYINM